VTPSATRIQAALSERYRSDEDELLYTLLNATSFAEAGFALSLLRNVMAESALVTALNLREVLCELPASPFIMHADTETIRNVLGLEQDRSALVSGDGDVRIELLLEGNLCFDIILKRDGGMTFLKTSPEGNDIIPAEALHTIMERPGTLERVIEIVTAMGLVFNPRVYFTIEEWLSENTSKTMTDLWAAF